MKPKRVIDHEPTPFDHLRGNWGVWGVTVEMDNGETYKGSMQGDGHLWALESFEKDHADEP